MMSFSTALRLCAASAAALVLSACVTLLPKAKPADLYRFGQPTAANAAPAEVGEVNVFKANSLFQRESAGDRMLTISRGRVAYVADTRWVAPAAVLWDQAVLSAFDANAGPARLISRGEPGAAVYVLRLDVRNFETRYDDGPKAAPTVVVRVRAALTGGKTHGLVDEKVFEAEVTPRRNRISEIVPAYDQAVAALLADVVAWTNENAEPL